MTVSSHPDISTMAAGTAPCPYANMIPVSMMTNYFYCWCILATIGILWVLVKLKNICSFIYLHFLRPATDLSKYGAKKGGWAVVTGCTDGIGLGYAEELAKRGFNLFLISRNSQKLDDLSNSLQSKFNIQTKNLAVDCAEATNENMNRIKQAVEGLDVGMLVNNVGLSTEMPTTLELHTQKQIEMLISVNVLFSTKMSQIMIPILKKRKHSAILNISSITADFCAPLLAVYSATKAYNDVLSRSLTVELRREGIDVVSIIPGYVMSSMSKIKRASFFVPTAARFASDSLNKMSSSRRVIPYWPHYLYWYITMNMPVSIRDNKLLSSLLQIRKKAIERQVQKKAE
jgi:17beta-estradiol 17-dehydrogenase / very-long-chain 3-oxoacyl-CoA reductase